MAAILYTSGQHRQAQGRRALAPQPARRRARASASTWSNHDDDVILAALPLSFDAGFSQLTTAFTVGAHVVLVNYLLPARRRAPVRASTRSPASPACRRCGSSSPTRSGRPRRPRSLRYFANTGGRMPQATLDKLRAIFPQAKPFLMYGLTEAFRSTYLDPAEVDRRPDSIGKAIPNAEILVVRPDGTPCDPGEEGELVHRGALVALGYWNDPERTAERFKPAPGPRRRHRDARARRLVGRPRRRPTRRASSTSSAATTR